jgi:crotonobetainyl-CoA:carnitine CoA-transferase CaiB-like acyl-CoA transferase
MKLDINVLDLSNFLPGPFCSMMLAEYGAQVIKIEDVTGGDPLRSLPPFHKYENSLFHFVNRNKKSAQINLKTPEGLKIIKELVMKNDVLIESFRPGKMESLGLSYEALSTINPRLVYCSITGFGQKSSFKKAAGHDINFVSLSGFLDLNKKIPPTQLGDLSAGLLAAFRIAAAVYSREKTGKGEYIDISITDAMISMMSPVIMEYFSSSLNSTVLTGRYPCYNVYETKDAKQVSLGALEPGFWSDFCNYFKIDMIDRQFDDSSEAFEIIKKVFKKKTFKELEKISQETSFCLTPVYSVKDMLHSDYSKSRRTIGKASHFSDGQVNFPGKDSKAAPRLGEHTAEILKTLGYKTDEIVTLKGSKVINYIM